MGFLEKIKDNAQKVVKDKKASPAKTEEQLEAERNEKNKEHFVISYDDSDEEDNFDLQEKGRE